MSGTTCRRVQDRLRRYCFLGAELAVQAAVGHPGPLSDRIDASPFDAIFAEQLRRGAQQPLAILAGFFLRYPHPDSLRS